MKKKAGLIICRAVTVFFTLFWAAFCVPFVLGWFIFLSVIWDFGPLSFALAGLLAATGPIAGIVSALKYRKVLPDLDLALSMLTPIVLTICAVVFAGSFEIGGLPYYIGWAVTSAAAVAAVAYFIRNGVFAVRDL